MNRETNTIGSKANSIGITNYVVEMKNEIENIKEEFTMLNNNGLKAVGSIAKGAFEIFSTIVVAGLLVAKATGNKPIVTYNDAMKAVMNSSLWSEDKVTVIDALKPNYKPELYLAVVEVLESSLWGEDKVDVIVKMCNQAEEA